MAASEVSLLRKDEGVIDLDSEVPERALYLRVSEQKLPRSRLPLRLYTRATFVRRRLCVP